MNPEFVEDAFEVVLGRKACVHQVALYVRPVSQPVVVIYLQFFRDDKGYMTVSQTLAEHYEATYTAIAVLKRMYGLKALVEIYDVFQ